MSNTQNSHDKKKKKKKKTGLLQRFESTEVMSPSSSNQLKAKMKGLTNQQKSLKAFLNVLFHNLYIHLFIFC